KPSVLGKPAPFSNSLDRIYFPKTKSVPKTNVSECLSKPVTSQTLPQTAGKAIIQLILFIVESGCTKHMTSNLKLLCNFIEKFLGTGRFGNDQFVPILGYGDLVQGNVTINRVYYIEGLNHNLFSVGQFCDADLEVAFRKSTCFVRDLQGNDLLTGNCGSDLYTISLQDSTSSTLLCLIVKASPTQAWLWHRRLSHLNFDYINLLLKKEIRIGLPKLKYVKDQLCSLIRTFATGVELLTKCTSHMVSGIPLNSLGIGTRFSTLDFITSSDSVAGIVSRCSSPILRESTGSSVDKMGVIAESSSLSSSQQAGIFQYQALAACSSSIHFSSCFF
nr:retrovirus-related Pol polyprotein from transposon TNT 1-94 [Tanacetum cinerariifolium]